MVKALLLALAMLASPVAMADQDPLLLRAQELEHNGRNLRLEGIITTVVGVGLLAETTILWLQGDDCMGPPSNCSGAKWMLLSAGLPVTAFGITLWWLGQDEIHQGERLRAWALPTRTGAMAGVGLTF